MTLTGQSLACKRGENLIFSKINFSVIPGSICFVKGPNGSGKSTLLRLLAGLLGTAEGHLTLDKIDITNDREIRAEKFLYLGHQNVLKQHVTVKEQISFWQGITKKCYDFETDPMNVQPILNKKLHQCSEGQSRRVALVRLAIEMKKLWLLDEPTASLDTVNVQLFKRILKDHCNNGGSAVIATHDNIGIKPSSDIHLSLDKSSLQQNDPFI